MQHAEEADLGTEMPWIAGDFMFCKASGASSRGSVKTACT
jgi:hypothetical protein